MCSTPHPAAKRAQTFFSYSNLGDPGLFPGSVQLEKEAIASLAELLHGKDSVGFIVSGVWILPAQEILQLRNLAVGKIQILFGFLRVPASESRIGLA